MLVDFSCKPSTKGVLRVRFATCCSWKDRVTHLQISRRTRTWCHGFSSTNGTFHWTTHIWMLIHSLIHIWYILFDSKIFKKKHDMYIYIYIYTYIHIQYIYIYIYSYDFVRCNASTQNQVMLAMSLEMAIPVIPAIPAIQADARSVSARASVGWSRLRRGGRLPREQLGDGVGGPYWNLGP